jgi:hypothetical protein
MSLAPFSNTNNNKMTSIPSNLDELPKEELVKILKRVASERDGLVASAANKKQKTAPAASSAPFDVKKTKKRILTSAKRLIKKTAHNRAKKPWTELSETVPSEEACLALFEATFPTAPRLA